MNWFLNNGLSISVIMLISGTTVSLKNIYEKSKNKEFRKRDYIFTLVLIYFCSLLILIFGCVLTKWNML